MDWLIIGLLGYFGHAISTSIDKVIMNRKHDIYTTSMLKLFIDGIIVLAIGLLFFDFPTSPKLILWSVLVGFLYAAGNITYYKSLKTKDIGVQVPYVNAAITLLIFLTALWFFRESAILSNYLGVLLILVGMYLVLSNRYKLPRIDKGLFLMTLLVIIVVIQYLVTKQALFQVQPIPLAATMYFSATIFTGIYQLFRKPKRTPIGLGKISISALFGAVGTMLIFTAVSLAAASKIYPIGGSTAVFAFIIGTLFLKEKSTWPKAFGVLAVFIGIWLTSM